MSRNETEYNTPIGLRMHPPAHYDMYSEYVRVRMEISSTSGADDITNTTRTKLSQQMKMGAKQLKWTSYTA